MTRMRKPLIRALEQLKQCIEGIRTDVGDALVEIRDHLSPPPPDFAASAEEGR